MPKQRCVTSKRVYNVLRDVRGLRLMRMLLRLIGRRLESWQPSVSWSVVELWVHPRSPVAHASPACPEVTESSVRVASVSRLLEVGDISDVVPSRAVRVIVNSAQ